MIVLIVGLIAFVIVYAGFTAAVQVAINKSTLKKMAQEIEKFERVRGGLSPADREEAKRGLVRSLNALKAKVKFDKAAMSEAQDKVNYVLYA